MGEVKIGVPKTELVDGTTDAPQENVFGWSLSTLSKIHAASSSGIVPNAICDGGTCT